MQFSGHSYIALARLPAKNVDIWKYLGINIFDWDLKWTVVHFIDK